MPEEIMREEHREPLPPTPDVPAAEGEGHLDSEVPATERAPDGEQRAERRDLELLMKRIQAASGGQAPAVSLQSDARELSEADETQRVQQLISLAETKGVEHAVRVARSLNDFYALDLLHDELVERLHAMLDKEAGQGR